MSERTICGALILLVTVLVIALIELAERYQRLRTAWHERETHVTAMLKGFDLMHAEMERSRELQQDADR